MVSLNFLYCNFLFIIKSKFGNKFLVNKICLAFVFCIWNINQANCYVLKRINRSGIECTHNVCEHKSVSKKKIE